MEAKTKKSTTTEIMERVQSPTPGFFKKVRQIGLALGAVGAALLAAPVALPAVITSVAGYLVAAGLVASAVSSAAVEDKVLEHKAD